MPPDVLEPRDLPIAHAYSLRAADAHKRLEKGHVLGKRVLCDR